MRYMNRKELFTYCILLLLAALCAAQLWAQKVNKSVGESISIVIPSSTHARIKLGASKLSQALTDAGYQVKTIQQNEVPKTNNTIIVGKADDPLTAKAIASYKVNGKKAGKEGFSITSVNNHNVII
ncbi:MAG: hypothetical protein ICV53_21535, partial [Flavisolibacter sp.]|nr:hypothetical protein [Flavisolibacter sp.]